MFEFEGDGMLVYFPTARLSGPAWPGKDPKPFLRVVYESGTRDTRSTVLSAPLTEAPAA